MQKLLSVLKNKYYVSLLGFLIWMSFLDRNDFFSQYQYYRTLKQLKNEQTYYETEIKNIKNDLKELNDNPKTLEKYAREKYFMRKENEDVFIIEYK